MLAGSPDGERDAKTAYSPNAAHSAEVTAQRDLFVNNTAPSRRIARRGPRRDISGERPTGDYHRAFAKTALQRLVGSLSQRRGRRRARPRAGRPNQTSTSTTAPTSKANVSTAVILRVVASLSSHVGASGYRRVRAASVAIHDELDRAHATRTVPAVRPNIAASRFVHQQGPALARGIRSGVAKGDT